MRLALLLVFCGLVQLIAAQPQSYHSCKHHHAQADLRPSPQNAASFRAVKERSDTFDILHYDIRLDVTTTNRLTGATTVDFAAKMDGLSVLPLDLESLEVDSILDTDGTPLAYTHSGPRLEIALPQTYQTGQAGTVTVYYGGTPMTCPSGFGGFYFEDGYAYNLGIGLQGEPHNFGRAWYPCFDNFVERASYTFHIKTSAARKAFASGLYESTDTLGNGQLVWNYRHDDPLPTYLSSVAAADYAVHEAIHPGEAADIPLQLIAKPNQLGTMVNNFENLTGAINALERWYGPYQWDQIGYVMTSRGAMEHSMLIAYPEGTGAGDVDNTGLLSHELAHHWWGNYVSPRTAMDMWVKEGGAEYGYHLTVEEVYGQEAFIDVVRDNHIEVLRTAHVRDGGYYALSPMPQEQTYGVHTYNKGAAMYHNLRGYLGDSLYQAATRYLLQKHAYGSVDAAAHQLAMEEGSGRDLSGYYDAWILNPGFADYEIDAADYAPAGSGFDLTLSIEQKQRATDHVHQDAPIQVTVWDADYNEHTTQVQSQGALTTATLNVPVEPVSIQLNKQQLLNLARTQVSRVLSEPGGIPGGGPQMDFDALSVDAPALVNLVHHWVAPDPGPTLNPGLQLSSNHYWEVGGIWPEGFTAEASFLYNRSAANAYLDQDLTSNTEDSIILVYRSTALDDWTEYTDYTKQKLAPNDGLGFMRLASVLPGQYAFANGEVLVSTDDPQTRALPLSVYPNPAGEVLQINGYTTTGGELHLLDALGRLQVRRDIAAQRGEFYAEIPVDRLAEGWYTLLQVNSDGARSRRRVLVQR